tara:strand:- start:7662 stop:7928 length:267 start_codon:yes stop_codon:yes gene_type:complete
MKILHEKCEKKLADNPKLPYTAYLVEYELEGETFYDIAMSNKTVEIFDHYYDKVSKFVNMTQAGGKVNPKIWRDSSAPAPKPPKKGRK